MTVSLVAGGTSFIGYHLCKSLLEKDETLVLVDNFGSGNLHFLNDLKKNKNVHVYIGNIDRRLFPREFLDKLEEYEIEKIDKIYNLTGALTKEEYLVDPIKSLDTYFIGTRNLLEICTKMSSQFIQLSSDEIGVVNNLGYIEGLKIAELLVQEFHKSHKIDTKILRIPEIYGSGMNHNKFICNILRSIKNNEKVIISENCTTINVCSFVNDLLNDLNELIKSTNYLPNRMKNIYIYSLPELFNIIQNIVKKDIDVEYHIAATSNKKNILTEAQTKRFSENIEKLYMEIE